MPGAHDQNMGIESGGFFYREQLERQGKMNERFAFGEVRTESQEYQEDVHALIRKHAKGNPITLAEAVETIKRYQPYEPDRRIPQDPKNPTKRFPNDLRQEIAKRLKQEDVYFWTAVGSIVDKNFAADGIIEVPGRTEEEQPHYVRLDLTLEKEKLAEYEMRQEDFKKTGRYRTPADEERFRDRVVLGEVPDSVENPRQYEAVVDDAASQVVEKLGFAPAAAKAGRVLRVTEQEHMGPMV